MSDELERLRAWHQGLTFGATHHRVERLGLRETITTTEVDARTQVLLDRSMQVMQERIRRSSRAAREVDPASPERRISAFWPNP